MHVSMVLPRTSLLSPVDVLPATHSPKQKTCYDTVRATLALSQMNHISITPPPAHLLVHGFLFLGWPAGREWARRCAFKEKQFKSEQLTANTWPAQIPPASFSRTKRPPNSPLRGGRCHPIPIKNAAKMPSKACRSCGPSGRTTQAIYSLPPRPHRQSAERSPAKRRRPSGLLTCTSTATTARHAPAREQLRLLKPAAGIDSCERASYAQHYAPLHELDRQPAGRQAHPHSSLTNE